MTPVDVRDGDLSPRWQKWLAESIRFFIAPLILFAGGFSTTDFLLSGVYTWPRTSRIFVLTLTIGVLVYEFVYKEQLGRGPDGSRAFKTVLYSCAIPYALGIVALVTLAKL